MDEAIKNLINAIESNTITGYDGRPIIYLEMIATEVEELKNILTN